MRRHGRGLFAVALVGGILVGASVAVAGTTTHVVCLNGGVVGFSGTVETVVWLTVAPPGGFANYSAWSQRSAEINGSTWTYGAGFSGSTNASAATTSTTNWTMRAVSSVRVAGIGSSIACPSYSLAYGPAQIAPIGGCSGCPVTPPVPAGIGSRSTLPSNFTLDGIPSTDFNGTYPSVPLGNFTWAFSGGDLSNWSESQGLAADGLAFSSPYQSSDTQDYLALSYSIPSNEIGLGVPIHLLTGGTMIAYAPVASMSPGWSSWNNITYIFPVSTDQGSWEVFEAAPGSPDSIGGLLFEQTAT